MVHGKGASAGLWVVALLVIALFTLGIGMGFVKGAKEEASVFQSMLFLSGEKIRIENADLDIRGDSIHYDLELRNIKYEDVNAVVLVSIEGSVTRIHVEELATIGAMQTVETTGNVKIDADKACGKCGKGRTNICDKKECEDIIFCVWKGWIHGIGEGERCESCIGLRCEDYGNREACEEDRCGFGTCEWKERDFLPDKCVSTQEGEVSHFKLDGKLVHILVYDTKKCPEALSGDFEDLDELKKLCRDALIGYYYEFFGGGND